MKSGLKEHIIGIMIFKIVMLTFLGYMFYGVIGKKKFTPDAVAQAFYHSSAQNPSGEK